MSILICPVCKTPLNKYDRTLKCANNHNFDLAKEGYVNLLTSNKPGDLKGDNKDMARSRREFLEKNYYFSLAEAVGGCVKKYTSGGDNILDICCGEGYYTNALTASFNRNFYGFDISKNMIKLAAKRKCGASFFVANIASIPVMSGTVKLAFHLFAPFHSVEFGRILSGDGVIVTAIPGKNHLMGLKEALYETPYPNDEKLPEAENLKLIEKIRVNGEIALNSQKEISSLFRMTPYFYHTPSKSMERLEKLSALKTPVEFVLAVYGK